MSKQIGYSISTPIGPLWDETRSAAKLGITPKRLIEMAHDHIAPHHHIDDGPPLFVWEELKEWAATNLYHKHDGSRLAPQVFVTAPARFDNPEYGMVPSALEPIWHKLGTYRPAVFPTCVYFLCRDGEVVYVGQTVGLAARIAQHMKEKEFGTVYYLPCERQDLRRLEMGLIKTLQPILNTESFVQSDISNEEFKAMELYECMEVASEEA